MSYNFKDQEIEFEVLTDEEIKARRNPTPGDHAFEVIKSELKNRIDGSGKMIALQLLIPTGKGGDGHVVFCHLVPGSKFEFLLKHFWDAVGHSDIYQSGKCNAGDFIGKKGTVRIKIGQYKGEDQAQVVDFIKSDTFVEDILPF